MLTPRDIENKMFKMSIKGYNVSQVDDFLQEVCDSYVELYMENKKNKEYIERLSGAVGQYKSMEDTLRDAVSVADKSTDRIEKAADKRASEIIRSAELTAESIIAGAEQKIAEESHRLDTIKRETELYRSKIVELLNAQLNLLEGYPGTGKFDTAPIQIKDAASKWYENIGAVSGINDCDGILDEDTCKQNFNIEKTIRVEKPVNTDSVTEKIVLTSKPISGTP